MNYRNLKKVHNKFLARYINIETRPTYFDIEKTFPALNELTQNFTIIKQEFLQALANTPKLPKYHEIDPGETKISNSTAKNWNVFMLYLLGYKPEQNRKLCPHTCTLLNKIPNMLQAFFSILDPGKSVPAHEGPSYAYLRYHLGLQVPKNNPPQIIVNNQAYTWQEGQAVLFDDSYTHEVRNNSDESRAVLIVDVLRPMPFLPTLINRFSANVIGKYTYGREVMQRLNKVT